jgi:uncharacterized protein YkwD
MPRMRMEEGRVIRFRCPGCKSVLLVRPEQAGKTLTCPRCGARIRVPQPATPSSRVSRWPLVLGIAAVGVLLVSLGAGGWWLTRWLEGPPESIATVDAPPPATVPATSTKRRAPAERAEKPTADVPPKQKLPEKNPSEEKPPVRKPPSEDKPPAPPPPPVEEKREIALAGDLPPELEFHIVDAINAHRAKANLGPVFLEGSLSRGCQAHARYLARNAARLSGDGANLQDEDAKLPGFSAEGRISARTAAIAADEPLTTIENWLKEASRRAIILEPNLHTFGAGFARNTAGQWFSVFDWTAGIDRTPREKAKVTGSVVSPAPGQTRVPLWFPGNETPDPLPEAKIKLAGYPITLTFSPGTRLDAVAARLTDKDDREVEIWLSWPGKPAIPKFPQRDTICLIARKSLAPNTRYHVEVTATVNGEAWSAKWSFTTITEGELHHEQAGRLLRTLNELRRHAGLKPVPLDAERSKACAAHALYLGLNAPTHPRLNWNEEKPDLPGYSEAGAAAAHTAAIQGGGGPAEAVAGLVDSLISRPQLLDPHLRSLGLGYTPFSMGGWIWVMDLQQDGERDAGGKEFLYPAPDQDEVPLVYPANEVPSPIPVENKERLAGYAITANLPAGVRVKEATGKLIDEKGTAVEGWLSTPAKPAITSFPQRSLCLLPRAPLKANTRYTMTFKAEIEGKPWERTWSFTTLKQPDRYSADLDEKMLARVNAARKAAGLNPVRLDAELSRGCQSHARYLSLNHNRTAAHGMAVHHQEANLPGASPEGARAAKESVIAVVLDPQTCVDGWLSTLYHRIPLLAPELERIGFGHARLNGRKWACVLDTGNGRAAQSPP